MGSSMLGSLNTHIVPLEAYATDDNAGEEDYPTIKFCGEFSDPNHPGGKRTIALLDGVMVGDYQLARVYGGGGRGEGREYVLPAVVLGDREIIIDFSSKGGPRDFMGVLDSKDGSIKFVKDGNHWPRIRGHCQRRRIGE